MKEFFLILFFSKTVLLTPDPINIHDETFLVPQEPVTAITNGASLRIDVSNLHKDLGIKRGGLTESRVILKKLIPSGSVKAELHSKGEVVTLNQESYSIFNDGAELVLSSEAGIPTNIAFHKIKIISLVNLDGVKISWRNFMH